MNNTESVNCQEALSIKVGRLLMSKGFGIADDRGVAQNSLIETPRLGILFKDPDAKQRKYLFGLIKIKNRRVFLGTLWFGIARGATEQSWVIEAYGRKYTELLRKLVDEMASTFNVKITVILISDGSRTEMYESEYGA